MNTECSIIKDLLPLYVEDMVAEETAQFVKEHIEKCPECRAELENLGKPTNIPRIEANPTEPDTKRSFKKIMQRINRQSYMLSYPIIILFVFLGFSWTGGENLMYNSLLMPIVGIFSYVIFGWRSVYKMPLLLLGIDLFVCISGLVALDLYSAFIWTLIYSVFVLVGIAIAFLLHFAFRKEKPHDN